MSKSVLKSHLQNFNMPSNFYSIILTPYNSLVIKSRVFRFVVLIRPPQLPYYSHCTLLQCTKKTHFVKF